jgi:hypothetical protein
MEETLFHTLLGIAAVGWAATFIDRPTDNEVSKLRSEMPTKLSALGYLVFAVAILILYLGGLTGMFFNREVFRWFFLAGTLGMVGGTWFVPFTKNKSKSRIFWGELFRLVDGAILGMAFSILNR